MARPYKDNLSKQDTICKFRLTEKEAEILSNKCKKAHTSISTFIRKAIFVANLSHVQNQKIVCTKNEKLPKREYRAYLTVDEFMILQKKAFEAELSHAEYLRRIILSINPKYDFDYCSFRNKALLEFDNIIESKPFPRYILTNLNMNDMTIKNAIKLIKRQSIYVVGEYTDDFYKKLAEQYYQRTISEATNNKSVFFS